MKLAPLNDSIIFEFIDDIRDGMFATKTQSGIILTNKDVTDSGQSPRWGLVDGVGPDVKDIKEGDYILIAPLRWTPSFVFETRRFAKTIEDEVLLVTNDVEDVSELFL